MNAFGTGSLNSTEALLVESFGVRLLAYLCGVREDLMAGRLQGVANLPDSAESVLTGPLVAIAQSVAGAIAQHPNSLRPIVMQFLILPSDGSSESLAMTLRQSARGGMSEPLPDTSSADAVRVQLLHLAVDSYPLLLLPQDDEWAGHEPILTFHQHPARSLLQVALRGDSSLRRLFPSDDSGSGKSGQVYTNFGRGGGIQDSRFGETLIGSAWDTLKMTGAPDDLESFVAEVDAHLDRIRAAALGTPVQVPAKVVLTGFKLPAGRTVDTPWGTMREIQEWERETSPPGLDGRRSGTDTKGHSVTVSASGEVVIDTTVPYTLTVVDPRRGQALSETWPGDLAGAEQLRRMIEAVELGILLATETQSPGSWVTARMAWQWNCDPLGSGSQISWNDLERAHFMPYEISEADCVELPEWLAVIDENWKPKVDIAVRRLISAANSRVDFSDRLVDAVIAWENLFGTNGETSLRISASMAWLLAPEDQKARLALQRSLNKIYHDRSRIVHGNVVKPELLVEQANAAVEHARDALRKLLKDRVDILLLEDGAERSAALLLGQ